MRLVGVDEVRRREREIERAKRTLQTAHRVLEKAWDGMDAATQEQVARDRPWLVPANRRSA